MRIKIKFYHNGKDSNYLFNKYDIQGMIYSKLLDAGISDVHAGNRFRFFTFSDVFPYSALLPDRIYNLIISSPSYDMLSELYKQLESSGMFYLSGYKFNIAEISKFDLKVSGRFITGSPIVLYKDNKTNTYFSLRNGDSIAFFLHRIRENAIKKFNLFYNENIEIAHMIFSKLKFHREVSVELSKMGKNFNIIGSTWYSMDIGRVSMKEMKFYKFIMDAGIGEKNSLGFGFINPELGYGQ